MDDFGSLLRKNRQSKGLTQAKLASLLQRKGQFIHDSVISRWETGDRQPGVDDRELLLAIGDALGMNEDEKNELLVKAELSPLQLEELDLDKMLQSLGPKRWRQTYFLHKEMGWDEKRIGAKLRIAFWDVREDIAKAELLEQQEDPEKSLKIWVRGAGGSAGDPESGKGGKLVAFTLGNCSDNVLTVERICLDVLSCQPYDEPPGIEARIMPLKYEVELCPDRLGEYAITEERFRYAGRDADDFDLVCNSPEGFKYNTRLNVYWNDLATKKQFVSHSDAFDLCFYKGSWLSRYIRVP